MRTVGLWLLLLLPAAAHPASTLVVYDGSLENGFADSSWAPTADYSLTNTSPTYGGGSHSIRFAAGGWGGLQFVAGNSEFDAVDYQSVTFYVNGGSTGGQQLQMYVCDDYNAVSATYAVASLIGGGIPKNAWTQVTLDFNAASLTYGSFDCIVVMDATGGGAQSPVYIDQIQFNPRTTALPGGATVNVSVNASVVGNAVSPLIFGVAFGNGARNAQMGYTVDRWGGNSTTRYNWQTDFLNTADDWYFENIPQCSGSCAGTPPAGNSADAFISAAIGAGIQPLMTIPTIGWTPRADSPQNHPYFAGFAVSKYGAQAPNPDNGEAEVDPYDTNAGTGDCDPSVNKSKYCVANSGGNPAGYITGNSPADTSTAVTPVFQAQWIAHMQSAFGTAAAGGVKFFSLDNEVMLWNSTHRDVHPVPPTYDEIWGDAQSYGAAIKAQEPNAVVTGPVTWGYCDLFGSAADSAAGNCLDGADRAAHGGLPFVAWYLQQVCANPLAGGRHLVDYLDLHWYPQGSNVSLTGHDDPTTAGLRLRSLKELYDSAWLSESWIGQDLSDTSPYHYGAPDLIPRVRAWIAQYCPGTRLAITEYNWGNDGTTSGAVAQAEALAIFAREGVDMATRWIAPDVGTNAEKGFSIFLNYDGVGSKVQGDSVAAVSSNVDEVGAYAFHGNARTFVLLTNKDTATHAVALTFDAAHVAAWTLYGFTGTAALAQTANGSMNGASLTISALPPMSASLLVIPDSDEIFKNGFQ